MLPLAVLLGSGSLFAPLDLGGDPDLTEPPVHAHDAVPCPLHHANLVGIRAIAVASFEPDVRRDAVPHGGVGVVYERTLIRRWLELEVATNVLFSGNDIFLPLDVVLKKPFHISHRFDPFLGVGAVVAFGVGEEQFVAAGPIGSAGMYVWVDSRWGVSAEVDFASLRIPHGWAHELEFASGPVLRF